MFRTPLCPSSGVQGCTLLHMVFSTSRKTASTQCTRPASRRPKTPAGTLSAENLMQYCTALHSWRWTQWCPKYFELL